MPCPGCSLSANARMQARSTLSTGVRTTSDKTEKNMGMGGTRKLIQVAIRIWVAASVFIAVGLSSAYAEGYWACRDGTWIAQGRPSHPKPLQDCALRAPVPLSEAVCTEAGGLWTLQGRSRQPSCKMQTQDAGRPCADLEECEGGCIVNYLPLAERGLIGKSGIASTMGACTPYRHNYGCYSVVVKGALSGAICVD
jgi:hypothetical protein